MKFSKKLRSIKNENCNLKKKNNKAAKPALCTTQCNPHPPCRQTSSPTPCQTFTSTPCQATKSSGVPINKDADGASG